MGGSVIFQIVGPIMVRTVDRNSCSKVICCSTTLVESILVACRYTYTKLYFIRLGKRFSIILNGLAGRYYRYFHARIIVRRGRSIERAVGVFA